MNEKLPSSEEAIKILRRNNCSPCVIEHCRSVAKLAVKIAKKCVKNGSNINLELVHIGALLHDIGRSKTHKINHGIVGAEIARSLNLPPPIVAIIERHIGGGISINEASEMGWPKKSYMPRTMEEKIIAYADKLIKGSQIVSLEDVLQQLREELGAEHPAIRRVKKLHKEIMALCQYKQ